LLVGVETNADASDQRITRSPADVLRLLVAFGVAVALILVEWLFGDTLVGFASDLLRGLDAFPTWMLDLVVVGTRVLGVVVLGGGVVWAVVRRRWRLLATAALAALLAELLVVLVSELMQADEGQALVDVGVDLGPLSGDRFTTVWGIGAVAAVLTAAAPWLRRSWRRASWVLLIGMMVTEFLSSPVSIEWLAAAVAGWLSGAAVLVALGAPSRRPTSHAVVDGLSSVGLPLRRLEQAGVDARGSTPYFAVAENGDELFVKALGEDERSADLLFRLYRRIQPRDLGDEQPFSTLRRAVEHEALVALAARDLPLRTPRLRAFATANPNGYVLAYDKIEGRSLDRLDPAEVTDGVLAAIWDLVGQLRRRRIAHRDLRLANIFLDDAGEVWLIDFGFSEMAASELLLATDVAELLASSSLYVGAERAVAQTVAAVDRATLSRALGRLRPWALGGATRTALKSREGLLDEARSRLAAAVASGDEREQ
jgi:tRNA A-37 threonylcarbamoyl transferase component Bud32